MYSKQFCLPRSVQLACWVKCIIVFTESLFTAVYFVQAAFISYADYRCYFQSVNTPDTVIISRDSHPPSANYNACLSIFAGFAFMSHIPYHNIDYVDGLRFTDSFIC